MASNKIKRERLEKELERIGDYLCDLMEKLEEGEQTAAQYSENMAKYNFWKRRYDRVDTELMLVEVAPSKRTGMTARNLKSKLV